ncbi:MAG TPA: hypothetical protein PK370_01945 [Candidatus Woesebacteria bacterium]|nr:hypothetical protein [Candidatus Woesebacteria bacterium]
MVANLSPSQIQTLKDLGIACEPISKPQQTTSKPYIALFSISGLALISLGGLILFKSKNDSQTPIYQPQPNVYPSPTQVPKSIQHYLLASQQFFSQALDLQAQNSADPRLIELLNQSILSATQAIKEFPSDYRGYQQRAKIYQSVLASRPDLISNTLIDYQSAFKLNPNSAEIAQNIAQLFAQKGDPQSTLQYLSLVIALEPTKAQNFYDLARIQQQTGQLTAAVSTYNQLLTILTDTSQKQQIQTTISSLQSLINQHPQNVPTSTPTQAPLIENSQPLLQANLTSQTIIAAPEIKTKTEVVNLSESNSLSNQATIPANTKQITLTNSQLKSTSQIYLSLVSGGKNQNLQILSKSDQSFVVGFDAPLTEDVIFNYWIVN